MSAHRKTSAAETRNIFARSGTLCRVIFTMGLLITRGRFYLRPIHRYSVPASVALIFALCAPISRATGVGYQNTQAPVLPTQVPITFGDSAGTLGGDGNGPVYVSLDSPFTQLPDGTAQIDRLGTSNVAPLLVGGQINPGLSQNHI